MILLEVDPQRPPLTPLERDAPRAVDVDRIASRPKAPQGVEVKTRLTKRFEGSCFIDRIQTKESSLLQIGSHAGALAGFKQLSQSTVPKTLDHQLVM